MIQIGVYILLSARRRAYFCKSIAIEMGGVSRYFSKVSGSGVDSTLLKEVKDRVAKTCCRSMSWASGRPFKLYDCMM